MYIQKNKELGQDFIPKSAAQAFNHVNTQPIPIRSLSYFNNENIGLAQAKPCLAKYNVLYFLPGSARLTPSRKKRIRRIARAIISRYISKARESGMKRGQYQDIDLSFEGHVDADTDPKKNKNLDLERAREVADFLGQQIEKEFSRKYQKGLLKGIPQAYRLTYTYSQAGSRKPRDSSPTRKARRRNRRVVICIRQWKIKDREDY